MKGYQMQELLKEIEELGLKDPVVFSWINMRKRSNIKDEDSLLYLFKALINSKNTALKVLEKHKQDSKVISIRRK
jgi:hypothetical protein